MGLDWIAGILELTGIWKVGSKQRIGFALGMAGGIAWVSYVFITDSTYGLLVICIPALIINLRNFIKWGKNV